MGKLGRSHTPSARMEYYQNTTYERIGSKWHEKHKIDSTKVSCSNTQTNKKPKKQGKPGKPREQKLGSRKAEV